MWMNTGGSVIRQLTGRALRSDKPGTRFTQHADVQVWQRCRGFVATASGLRERAFEKYSTLIVGRIPE